MISRIPGANHCAWEGALIQEFVRRELAIPVIDLEVSPVADPMLPTLQSRLEALMETARSKRSGHTKFLDNRRKSCQPKADTEPTKHL